MCGSDREVTRLSDLLNHLSQDTIPRRALQSHSLPPARHDCGRSLKNEIQALTREFTCTAARRASAAPWRGSSGSARRRLLAMRADRPRRPPRTTREGSGVRARRAKGTGGRRSQRARGGLSRHDRRGWPGRSQSMPSRDLRAVPIAHVPECDGSWRSGSRTRPRRVRSRAAGPSRRRRTPLRSDVLQHRRRERRPARRGSAIVRGADVRHDATAATAPRRLRSRHGRPRRSLRIPREHESTQIGRGVVPPGSPWHRMAHGPPASLDRRRVSRSAWNKMATVSSRAGRPTGRGEPPTPVRRPGTSARRPRRR